MGERRPFAASLSAAQSASVGQPGMPGRTRLIDAPLAVGTCNAAAASAAPARRKWRRFIRSPVGWLVLSLYDRSRAQSCRRRPVGRPRHHNELISRFPPWERGVTKNSYISNFDIDILVRVRYMTHQPPPRGALS